MILVILGTQDKSFERLIRDVEELVKKNIIKDKVIVQSGYTKYKSDILEIVPYLSQDDFDKYIKDAKYIITHGGVGSILTSLKYSKKVIAVPRLSKYKEHTNDHQIQIIDKFTKDKYILSYIEDGLEECVKKISSFKPNKFVSNNSKFVDMIDNYIVDSNHSSWLNKIFR